MTARGVRRLAALALFGAMLSAAVGHAGVASADSDHDYAYLHAVHDGGIGSANGDAALIRTGQAVCVAFYQGFTFMQVANQLDKVNPMLPDYGSGTIIGAAIGAYCPEFQWKIHDDEPSGPQAPAEQMHEAA